MTGFGPAGSYTITNGGVPALQTFQAAVFGPAGNSDTAVNDGDVVTHGAALSDQYNLGILLGSARTVLWRRCTAACRKSNGSASAAKF